MGGRFWRMHAQPRPSRTWPLPPEVARLCAHVCRAACSGPIGARSPAPLLGKPRSVGVVPSERLRAASGGPLPRRKTCLGTDSSPAVGEIGGKANRPDSRRLGGPVAILPEPRLNEFDVGTQRVRANFPTTCLTAVGIAARPCNCPWDLLVNGAATISLACCVMRSLLGPTSRRSLNPWLRVRSAWVHGERKVHCRAMADRR